MGVERALEEASTVSHGRPGAGGRRGAAAAVLERGALIDRYIIVEPLGAGGMGVVYAAYDPELDRRVAIKFLHPEEPGDDARRARARLVREARALARLAHPNVVGVFDANAVDDEVFVVMELVEGENLREWLSRERPWRDVVALFLQAGRGLAAAHRANLVHRDFKPENVLIGADGRARVADFGLAQGVDRGAPQGGALSAASAMTTVTRPGAILGTLAYMAPEQIDGEPADAQTDQFSFCVALYEALYGERPFPGQWLGEVRAAIQRGRVPDGPKGTSVPPWVRAVILRGLAESRAQRFESMASLLAALEHDPVVARNRWLARGGVALVSLALAGAMYARAQRAAEPLCGGDAMLAGVWDSGVRSATQAAFLRASGAQGDEAFGRAASILDAYAKRWKEVDGDVCRAETHQDKDATRAGFRLACLDRQRVAMKSLTSLFARADPQIVSRAPEAAYALGRPEACRDDTMVGASVALPDDSAKRERVMAARTRLADARSLVWSKPREARQQLVDLLPVVRAIPHDATEGEVLTLLGISEERLGDYVAGVEHERQGVAKAERAGDDATVAEAAARIAFILADKLFRFDEADPWLRLAEAACYRSGSSGQLEAAVEQAHGVVLQAAGRPDRGLPFLERSYEISRSILPADHPEVLRDLNNLGYINQLLGRHEVALHLHEQTVAVQKTDTDGRVDGRVAIYYANLGSSSIGLGNYDGAIEYLHRSTELSSQTNPRSFWIAWALSYQSLAETSRGDAAAGGETARRGLALASDELSTQRRLVLPLLVNLGNALLVTGAPAEALTNCQRAANLLDPRLVSQDQVYEWDPLACVGRALLELRRPNEALAPLERSVTLPWRVRAGDLATARFALARALRATGESGGRPRALATQARDELAVLPHRRAELEAVERWLGK